MYYNTELRVKEHEGYIKHSNLKSSTAHLSWICNNPWSFSFCENHQKMLFWFNLNFWKTLHITNNSASLLIYSSNTPYFMKFGNFTLLFFPQLYFLSFIAPNYFCAVVLSYAIIYYIETTGSYIFRSFPLFLVLHVEHVSQPS